MDALKDPIKYTLDASNGELFIGSQEGESLERKAPNVIIIPGDMPTATAPYEVLKLTVEDTVKFMDANFAHLKNIPDHRALSEKELYAIAYHRFLAVKVGLVSEKFDPATFNVKYTEVVRLPESEVVKIHGYEERMCLKGFDGKMVDDITKSFTDRLCLIAFVFRARGHHYLDTYEELYVRVWRKCRYEMDRVHVTFQDMATLCFHAIYPVLLDGYWEKAVQTMICYGALIKRFDSAPAGTAGIVVLRQGVQDIAMVAPGITERLKSDIDYLNNASDQMKEHRFRGSVNARYYGTRKIDFEEKRLAAIASTILAALHALAEDAPLAKSAALKRIADNAPITGAVLGKAVSKIVDKPQVVDALLIESGKGIT